MRRLVIQLSRRFTPATCFLALLSFPLDVSASSPPPDGMHFCTFHSEQWQREHPRPAAKQPADLSVGIRLDICASAGPRQVFFWLMALKDWVHSVAISRDGKLLASASSDGTALLWEIATQARIAIVGKSQRDITSVSFSPDGLLLAVATIESAEGMGSTVRLWDVVTQEHVAAFGHPGLVRTVVFSPDGATLASGHRMARFRRGILRRTSPLKNPVLISMATVPLILQTLWRLQLSSVWVVVMTDTTCGTIWTRMETSALEIS